MYNKSSIVSLLTFMGHDMLLISHETLRSLQRIPCRDLKPGLSECQADDLPISHRACIRTGDFVIQILLSHFLIFALKKLVSGYFFEGQGGCTHGECLL